MLLLNFLHLLLFLHTASAQCSSAIYSTQDCEGATLSLTCSVGSGIVINSAFYGRIDQTTCVHQAMSDTNCISPTATSVVSNNCNGLMSCDVEITNPYFGGDPCTGSVFFCAVL